MRILDLDFYGCTAAADAHAAARAARFCRHKLLLEIFDDGLVVLDDFVQRGNAILGSML
jgi:hypothetical protein